MSINWVLALGAFSLLCVILTRRRLSREARIPADVYWGFYTLTVFIGAAIIGLPETRVMWLAYSLPIGLDAAGAPSDFGFKYWFLAFAPYIVPCIAILFVRVVGAHVDNRSWVPKPIAPSAVVSWCVAGVLVIWGVYLLSNTGQLGANLLQDGGDYDRNIALRYQLFERASPLFFRIAYTCLPALCVYALYRALDRGNRIGWFLLAIGAFVSAEFFYLSSFQRSYVIVLVVAVGLVLLHTGVIGYRKAIIMGGLMFIALAFLTFLLSGGDQINLLYTFGNVIFRLPSAVPFYDGLFPGIVPFAGLDVGLKLFNIGPAIDPNQVVFNHMFPEQAWVQGASPAPAHYYAYAEGGMLWSLVYLLASGLFIGLAGMVAERARSPLSRTLFIFMCIALYYQTQAAFWDSVHQASYGLIWPVMLLVFMSASEWVLRLAREGVRPLSAHMTNSV